MNIINQISILLGRFAWGRSAVVAQFATAVENRTRPIRPVTLTPWPWQRRELR